MGASDFALPSCRELSQTQLLLLEENFKSHEEMANASDLAAELIRRNSDLEAKFAALRKDLTSLTVSSISRSFLSKFILRDIAIDLQNLCLNASRCATSMKFVRAFGKDLHPLQKVVRKIKAIGDYAETTLQLETLVGDLEDAAICVRNQHAGNAISTGLCHSSIFDDFKPRQKQVLQAVATMNDIEDILINAANSLPQWHCLLKSVDARVSSSLNVIRAQILADYRSQLSSLGWPPKLVTLNFRDTLGLPNPLVLIKGERWERYSLSFQALCVLQHLQKRQEERKLKLSGQNKDSRARLWAIDELLSPIAFQIEHHFSKWTEQPELMFVLVRKIAQDFVMGVDDILQPLIDKARVPGCSAREAWLSAMVQMLSEYLAKNIFPALVERYNKKDEKSDASSSWLHLLDLAVDFDKQMELLVNPEADSEKGTSRSLSLLVIFCYRSDWLKIWGKIELKDALKKLKTELQSKRAWLVCSEQGAEFHIFSENEQFLLSNREDYNAPWIADFVLKLAWGLVERCQTLPGILLQIQFIKSTSSKLLWYFFKAMLLRGKLGDDDDVVIRLCILVNTARYCESKLQEWSDDMCFLELGDCFFGEEIRSLAELQTSWLMEMISDVLYQFEALSLKYVQSLGHWSGLKPDVLALSGHWIEALDMLRNRLHVIRMELNPKDFLDLWRGVANGLDHFVVSSIIACDGIFDEAVAQFGVDMEGLFFVFGSFCARPEAFFPGIRDSLALLEMGKEKVQPFLRGLCDGEGSFSKLQSCGISCLSSEQALKILRKRCV